MSRWPVFLAIPVFALSCMAALPLSAQVGGYQPAPALSPWLNLYQKQGGPVDNYHLYVQPQLQLRDTLQSQQMGIQANSAAVDAVGERNLSQREASFAGPQQTGASATFFNQGSYFNNFRGIGAGTGGTPGTGPGLNRPNLPNYNTGNGGGIGGTGGANVPTPNFGGIGRGGVL